MSKLIYLHNADEHVLDIILDALRKHGYNPEHSSTPHISNAENIYADLAFFCSPTEEPHRLTVGDLTLDLDNICLEFKNGERAHLTPIEFSMLSYLMKHPNRAVSRKELIPAVWGVEYDGTSRVADDTAKRLRKKMKGSSTVLETVWNFGFRLNPHV